MTSGHPTIGQITEWLNTERHPTDWAPFLHGLPWDIIKPITQMAAASKLHPLATMGVVSIRTADPEVRATLLAHLDTIPQPAGPNRAQRRATQRTRRR